MIVETGTDVTVTPMVSVVAGGVEFSMIVRVSMSVDVEYAVETY